jgi:hypothetical protein
VNPVGAAGDWQAHFTSCHHHRTIQAISRVDTPTRYFPYSCGAGEIVPEGWGLFAGLVPVQLEMEGGVLPVR